MLLLPSLGFAQGAEGLLEAFDAGVSEIIASAEAESSLDIDAGVSGINPDAVGALLALSADLEQMIYLAEQGNEEAALELHEKVFLELKEFHEAYGLGFEEDGLRALAGAAVFAKPEQELPARASIGSEPVSESSSSIRLFAVFIAAIIIVLLVLNMLRRKRSKSVLALFFLVLFLPGCLAVFNAADMHRPALHPGNRMAIVWSEVSIRNPGTGQWHMIGGQGFNNSGQHAKDESYLPKLDKLGVAGPKELEVEFTWVIYNNSTDTDQAQEQSFSYIAGYDYPISWVSGTAETCVGVVSGSLDFSSGQCSPGTYGTFNLAKGKYLALRTTGKVYAHKKYHLTPYGYFQIYLGRPANGYFDYDRPAFLPVDVLPPLELAGFTGTYKGKMFYNGYNIKSLSKSPPPASMSINWLSSETSTPSFRVGDALAFEVMMENTGETECDYQHTSVGVLDSGGSASYVKVYLNKGGIASFVLQPGEFFHINNSGSRALASDFSTKATDSSVYPAEYDFVYPGRYKLYTRNHCMVNGEVHYTPASWSPATTFTVAGPAVYVERLAPKDLVLFGSGITDSLKFTAKIINHGTVDFGSEQGQLPAYVRIYFFDADNRLIDDPNNPYEVQLPQAVPAIKGQWAINSVEMDIVLPNFNVFTGVKAEKVYARAFFKESDVEDLVAQKGSHKAAIDVPDSKYGFFKQHYGDYYKFGLEDTGDGDTYFMSAYNQTLVKLANYFSIESSNIAKVSETEYSFFIPSGLPEGNFDIDFFNPDEAPAKATVSWTKECSSFIQEPLGLKSAEGSLSFDIPAVDLIDGFLGQFPLEFTFSKPSAETECILNFGIDYFEAPDFDSDIKLVVTPDTFNFNIIECRNCISPLNGETVTIRYGVGSYKDELPLVVSVAGVVNADDTPFGGFEQFFLSTEAGFVLARGEVSSNSFVIPSYSAELNGVKVILQATDGDSVLTREVYLMPSGESPGGEIVDLSRIAIVRQSDSGRVLVEDVFDDDGSIESVELFVVDALGAVASYSFDGVAKGQDLLTVLDGEFIGIYFNFMDRDGDVQNAGVFIPIEGIIVPVDPDENPVHSPLQDMGVQAELAEDGKSFSLNISALQDLDFGIASVLFDYSISGGLNASGSVPLENESVLWNGVLEPFEGSIYLNSKFKPIPLDSEQRFRDYSRPVRWFSLTTCDANAVTAQVAYPVGESPESALLASSGGYSNISIERNSAGDIRVTSVVDDDDSIQVVSIHSILNGVDSTYTMRDAKEGDTLASVVPDGTTAYFNFMDFDGSMINMQFFRSFATANDPDPETPRVRAFASGSVTPVVAENGLTYTLLFKAELKPGITPAEVLLNYKIGGESYSRAMVQVSDGVYSTEIGPLAGYTFIYSSFEAVPVLNADVIYSGYSLGHTSFDLLLGNDCPDPLIELCFNEVDDDADGLIDEGCDEALKEKCGNGIDDDDDGLIDERPCEEEEIGPPSEWVLKVEKSKIVVGEVQKIWVEDASTGNQVPGVSIVIESEKDLKLSTGEVGLLEYRVKSEGDYVVLAVKGDFEGRYGFRAVALLTSTVEFLSDAATFLFGQTIVADPVELSLLLLLSIIVALLAFDKSRLLFKEVVKSTVRKREETIVRVLIAVVLFALPFIAVNRLSYYGGVGVALLEIVLIFLASFVLSGFRARKPIKV